MASTATNREERKLMRQRGAANRQVQNVNFGFTFGSPNPQGSKESPARHPTSKSRQTTQSPRQADNASKTRLSLPSAPLSRVSPDKSGSQRSNSGTPRSLRNPLPEGPSVFDIPADDGSERSPKRRKLSSDPNAHERESSSRTQTNSDTRYTGITGSQEPTVHGTARTTSHPEPTDSPSPPEPPQHSSPEVEQGNDEPQQVSVPRKEDGQRNHSGENEDDVDSGSTRTPPAQTLQRKKKKRKSVVLKPRRSRKGSDIRPQQQPDEPDQRGIATMNQEEAVDERTEEQNEEEYRSTNQGTQGQAPGKQPKPRKQGPHGAALEQPSSPNSATKKRSERNGRSTGSLRTKPRAELQVDHGQRTTTEGITDRIDEVQEEEDEEFVPENKTASRAKQRRKEKRQAESSQTRGSRQNQHSGERTDTAAAPESEPQPDNSTSGAQSKRKSKATGQQQGSPKQRKPRGETVPVVVHRLANVSALDAGDDDSEREERHDPGEPSAKQKYPTRSGVNSADVLAQICSETLEKTMSTLENSISQESNSTRRAEWTRKHKAVETFSTELGNRLFDMSEVIESNFVMAAQLKKEKKEMSALRNQLMDVRKERGEIAVRIDDVRRRFAEDEKWSKEQDTLNNALHDLQLALDRKDNSRGDATEADPLAGLEFLLRTVAQDVSSAAPDSHGGLLNQVRGFNAQLERTASLLDQKQ